MMEPGSDCFLNGPTRSLNGPTSQLSRDRNMDLAGCVDFIL